MIEAFHRGGWGMYPTAIAGTVLVVTAAHYAWRPGRPSLVIGLGVLTFLVSCLGFVTGVIKTTLAAGQMDPYQPERHEPIYDPMEPLAPPSTEKPERRFFAYLTAENPQVEAYLTHLAMTGCPGTCPCAISRTPCCPRRSRRSTPAPCR